MKLDVPLDIPIRASVYCADGLCGHMSCVLLNPVTDEVTHVVVRERAFPYSEYMLPIDMVTGTQPDRVDVRCSGVELHKQQPFVETEFIQPGSAALSEEYSHAEGTYRLWPYAIPGEEFVPIVHERVPRGELAVRRGMPVHATDGRVGRVDEFLVDPDGDHITHLVLREGHLWGARDITIPVSDVAEIREDGVHLKLSKQQVAALEAVPVHRRW
jgi:sporulation protein YlmC with PRC-barrel domain